MSISVDPQLEVLSTKEAAEYLGLSVNTLAGWRYLNQGPTYQRLGTSRRAKVRYRRADIDAWLGANTVVPDGKVPADGIR